MTAESVETARSEGIGEDFRQVGLRIRGRFPLRRYWDWRRRERAFRRFVARLPDLPIGEGAPVAVVVQPWLLSDVPWYSLLLAFGLRREGRPVVIIWDDIPYDRSVAGDTMVNASIGRLLAAMGSTWKIHRLSEYQTEEPDFVPADQLEKLAELNVTWRFRGHSWPAEAATLKTHLQAHFGRVARAAEAALRHVSPTAVVMPGGVFSTSGVIRTVAGNLGMRVATYDSGPGIMLAAGNGVAAWLSDIPRAVREIGTSDDDLVCSWAEQELAGRRGDSGAKSVFGELYQVPLGGESISGGDVLIPLNQSYDTAALGRHRVFKSQVEFLVSTVGWVLENSEATVVVRRHPIERRADLRSVDEYGDILLREFGPDPRVQYVPEDAAVSTYELLSRARLVVPYTSTVGVEAALQGIPVVTESASYYSELGFVWPAFSAEEFQNLLRRGLDGDLSVTAEARKAALRTYYATQLCNFVLTTITPAREDFMKWVSLSPEEVLADPAFQDIVETLGAGTPVAVLRHRRRLAAAKASVSRSSRGG